MRRRIRVICARPYEEVRAVCHTVKTEPSAAQAAAAIMAGDLPDTCVLIPVPSHEGQPGHALTLATFLAIEGRKMGKTVHVRPYLVGNRHRSLCEVKHEGGDPSAVRMTFRFRNPVSDRRDLETLTEIGVQPVIVDNVVDTGKTVREALRALGTNAPVAAIGDTGNWKPQRKDKR